MSCRLLVVRRKMLHRCKRAAFFDSPCHCCRKTSGHIRIFTEILKIASVQRIAVDINSRSEQSVYFVCNQLFSFHHIKFFHHWNVKRTCKQCSDWKLCCLQSALHTDTGRSVCTADSRDSIFIQAVADTSKCGCRTRCYFRAAHSFPAHDRGKFLFGQLRDKCIQICFSLCNIRKTDSFVSGDCKLLRQMRLNPFL